MKLIKIYTSVFLSIILITVGCSSHKEKDANVSVDVVRLDSLIANYNNLSEMDKNQLMTNYATEISDYLYMMGLTNDNLESEMDSLLQTKAFKIFYPDVNNRYNFEAKEKTENTLGIVSKNLNENFPAIPNYKFFGIISPFNQTIMTVDSAMYIALNHYLGVDYPGYENMEDYRRRVKTFDNIKYDAAEAALSLAYKYQPAKDESLINRLLYEGALVNAILKVTNGNLSEMSGWSEEQTKILEENEGNAWRTIIGSEYLYSSDPGIAERLFSPAPSTPILSPDAPGRAGRFVGWKIVNSFLKNNPEYKDEDLLSPKFYNDPSVLQKSKYDPK